MAIELDDLAGPEGGNESTRYARYWLDQINNYNDNTEVKDYLKRGEAILKRYRNDRTRVNNEGGQRRYASLWSNIQILKPALYGRQPQAIAERRFKDKDPTGRGAAQILERALRNEVEICQYHSSVSRAVLDYLLPGAGVVWVRYEPEIAEGISLPIEPQTDMRDSQGELSSDEEENDEEDDKPKTKRLPRAKLDTDDEDDEEGDDEQGDEDDESDDEDQGDEEDEGIEKLEETEDRVIRESTPVDYIPWNDFFTFPVRARTWSEVTAIAKRVYMSREQMIKRFGKKIGKAIPLQRDDRGNKNQNTLLWAADQDKGEVYEIWSKDDTTVYWVAMGYDYLCDRKDDFLNLEKFYPVPEPLFANATNNTLIPVADYIQYQDQAIQIDELTQRIALITKACKVGGVYNAAAKDIQRLFQESLENELIPVDDWAAFAEKGGVAGNISFIPVKDLIGVLNELVMIKAKQVEEMDRITGITDIMRGTTDARETLGGQRLKSNSSGTRLTDRQNEVARFARDVIRIMADIMCQHFTPQSLIEASGALYEEGLGPDDMPSPATLEPPAKPPAPALPAPGAAPGAGPSSMFPAPTGPVPPPAAGGAPPMPGAMPQQRPPMAPGAPPPQPPGSNVVPIRPPMAGAGGPMPPQGAPMPPAMPPQPPIDSAMLAKMASLQRIQKAIALLRDEKLRGFRVDIEVDSTIFPDASQEKEDRTEFVNATTAYIEKCIQVGSLMPEAVPLLGKLLQFGVRGFRVGRDLENAIEEFCDEAVVAAKQKQQQAQQQPNPEQIKAQAEVAQAQSQEKVQTIRAQADIAKSQASLQSTKLQSQAEAQDSQAEIQRQAIENQGEAANARSDIVQKQYDMKMRQMEVQMEQLRMQFEAFKLHKEAMAPPEPPPVPSALNGNSAA